MRLTYAERPIMSTTCSFSDVISAAITGHVAPGGSEDGGADGVWGT